MQPADEGSYTVTVTSAAGSATSDPAVLTVHLAGSGGPALFLQDSFTDGIRTNQALPDSTAWFTSSGSSNLTVVGAELKQAVSSSRTLLAYLTSDQNQPATLAKGERLTLRFAFRFSAFDVQADNFRVGLLRGVANPSANSGRASSRAARRTRTPVERRLRQQRPDKQRVLALHGLRRAHDREAQRRGRSADQVLRTDRVERDAARQHLTLHAGPRARRPHPPRWRPARRTAAR